MSKALTLAGAALAFALWLADTTASELRELSHDRTAAILQIGE